MGTSVKPLWRGVFNFQREVRILYARAYTEKQAWLVMCRRIAKIHDVHLINVMAYFDGSKPNYEIAKEGI